MGEFGDNLRRDHTFDDVSGLTVDKVLDMLGVKRTEVSMVIVNGLVMHIDGEIPLNDGDEVSLLPALEGG